MDWGKLVSGPFNGKGVIAGTLADQFGLPEIPCTKVEGACASGGIAFRHAVLAIATGQCDAALVIGVETMTHAPTAQTLRDPPLGQGRTNNFTEP